MIAMSYQQQPSFDRPSAYNSKAISPLTVRDRFENTVPPGTVASRVNFLQSLANTSSAPPPADQRHKPSQFGFSRRMTNRFERPTSQSANLVEERRVETRHSFLGLSTPRRNHDEEHALADHRRKYNLTPGIHSQVHPQGLIDKVQHDAASPRSVVPPSKYNRKLEWHYNGQETKEETSLTGDETKCKAERSYFPDISNTYNEAPESHFREVSGQDGSVRSGRSNLPTSTMRRKSVRELYDEYGIERPEGLASEEHSFEVEDTLRAIKRHRLCHLCLWINTGPEPRCWKCGHRLCIECDAVSPLPQTRNIAKPDYWSRDVSRSYKNDDMAEETHSGSKESMWPEPEARLSPDYCCLQDKSEPQEKFPVFQIQGATPRSVPRKEQMLPENPMQFLTGSQQSSGVKNSPFLIADRQVSTSVPKNHKSLISTPCPNSLECDSPTCRATHDGHAPYRHSIACTSKQRHLVDGTDGGYVADASHIEEEDAYYSHSPRPNSGLSYNASHFEPSPSLQPVECRGYPRTGHSCNSGTSSIWSTGVCQHCLDDCQCEACQDTDHIFRCCTHQDHNSMVHQHYQSSRKAKPKPKSTAPPSKLPPEPSQNISPSPIRKTSSARTTGPTKSNISNPIAQMERALSARPLLLSKKNSMCLPTSKQSTPIKEAVISLELVQTASPPVSTTRKTTGNLKIPSAFLRDNTVDIPNDSENPSSLTPVVSTPRKITSSIKIPEAFSKSSTVDLDSDPATPLRENPPVVHLPAKCIPENIVLEAGVVLEQEGMGDWVGGSDEKVNYDGTTRRRQAQETEPLKDKVAELKKELKEGPAKRSVKSPTRTVHRVPRPDCCRDDYAPSAPSKSATAAVRIDKQERRVDEKKESRAAEKASRPGPTPLRPGKTDRSVEEKLHHVIEKEREKKVRLVVESPRSGSSSARLEKNGKKVEEIDKGKRREIFGKETKESEEGKKEKEPAQNPGPELEPGPETKNKDTVVSKDPLPASTLQTYGCALEDLDTNTAKHECIWKLRYIYEKFEGAKQWERGLLAGLKEGQKSRGNGNKEGGKVERGIEGIKRITVMVHFEEEEGRGDLVLRGDIG